MASALRITRRCLLEDLGFGRDDIDRPLTELAVGADESASLVGAFLAKATEELTDRDRMTGLATGRVPTYAFRHGKRSRGLIWPDAATGVTWLLAAHHTHRSGERADSYAYFRALSRDQLRPGADDVHAARMAEALATADAAFDSIPELLLRAHARRGSEVRGSIGRVPIALVMDAGPHPPVVYLAVSMRLTDEGPEPPPDWLFAIVTRVYRTRFDGWDDLPWASPTKFPGRVLRADEVAFAHFVADWRPN